MLSEHYKAAEASDSFDAQTSLGRRPGAGTFPDSPSLNDAGDLACLHVCNVIECNIVQHVVFTGVCRPNNVIAIARPSDGGLVGLSSPFNGSGRQSLPIRKLHHFGHYLSCYGH